jgi:hypothetical protein
MGESEVEGTIQIKDPDRNVVNTLQVVARVSEPFNGGARARAVERNAFHHSNNQEKTRCRKITVLHFQPKLPHTARFARSKEQATNRWPSTHTHQYVSAVLGRLLCNSQ